MSRHLRWHGRHLALLLTLLAAVLAYFRLRWGTFAGFVTAIDHDTQFMQDFVDVYYPTARSVLANSAPTAGYYYTSFFALLLSPLGSLPLRSALVVWGVVQALGLAALCFLPVRLLRLRPLPAVLFVTLTATSFPILHNLRWGQVSAPLTACVLGSLLAWRSGRRVLAGALLAFAAAVKLYPAFFVLYFVAKRDARACVSFLVAVIVFAVVIPASVLGLPGFLGFEEAVFSAIGGSRWVARDVNSQYAGHVLLRWLAVVFDGRAPGGVRAATAAAGPAGACLCLATAFLLQRRVDLERHWLAVIALWLSVPFLLRTSWSHYFVYLPFGQVAVIGHWLSALPTARCLTRVAVGLPIASLLLSSIFVFDLFPGWRAYAASGALFVANLLLLVALAVALASRPVDAPGGDAIAHPR